MAAAREMMTHTVAIRRLFFSSSLCLIAMKRRRTCGIPKYPRPQASMERAEMMLYGAASPKRGTPFWITCSPASFRTGVEILKNSRYPGIVFRFVKTSPIPPAAIVPSTRMMTRARTITTACMKSLALSARNPPRNV